MRRTGRRRVRQLGVAAGVVVGTWGLSLAARVVHGAVLVGRPRGSH